MANVMSIGATGAGDILGLDPSDDNSDERRYEIFCPYLYLRRIVRRSRV